MSDGELVGPWADLVVAGLVAGGVRDVVVSPGSRSTPFLLASLRRTELTCWSVTDERSAGFFALGRVKATGAPVALLSTSGTAPAHYLPAVIEASATGCPLVLLTADRPHELIHCGAPQTIEQTRLFDGHVRHAVDLGNPDARVAALRGARRRVEQAVALARGPRPGPVHVNARAAKPLEPTAATSPAGHALARAAAEAAADGSGGVLAPSRLQPASEAIAEIAARLVRAERGLVVCGALTPAQAPPPALLGELVRRLGFALVCETTSQLRTATVGAEQALMDRMEPLLLDARFRLRVSPDVVLQIGAAPLAAGWDDWLRPPVERLVLSPHGWADPSHSARVHVEADLRASLELLIAQLPARVTTAASARRSFVAELARLQGLAAEAVRVVLEGGPEGLTEGRAVAATLGALPRGSPLVLGSSLPLRAVDLFTPRFDAAVPVVAHRGTNGIDGLVSTAAGVAVARGPTTLLLGDVSFLHDVGGLWAARHARAPLVVVVLNDGGGRIFEELPVATVASSEELTYLTTPHAFELRHAAELFGHRYRGVEHARDLDAALAAAHAAPGVTVIDARLAPGEPHGELARLRAEIARRMAREVVG